MSSTDAPASAPAPANVNGTAAAAPRRELQVAYRWLAYFGLFSFEGALLYGFAYDASAAAGNYLFNFLLYLVFAAPHLLLTRSWVKRALWSNPAGSPRERRVYILITVVTWLAVLIFYRPLPGPEIYFGETLTKVVGFVGTTLCIGCIFLFFQGANFEMLNGLLGVHGAEGAFSHGETPLFTEGPYAEVRHPMYRAAVMMGACTLLIHPNAAQLFWVVLVCGTFVAFIPVEEAQMIAARGDDYRRYRQQTPYRLFRRIW